MNGLASTKLGRKPHCDSVYRLPDRVNSAFFNASISSLRAFALHQTAVLKPETWSRQSDQSRFWAMSTISDMFASLSHVSNMKKIKCQQIPNNHSATECFVSCKVVQESKQQHNMKPLDFSTAACSQNHHLKDSKTNENTWFHDISCLWWNYELLRVVPIFWFPDPSESIPAMCHNTHWYAPS